MSVIWQMVEVEEEEDNNMSSEEPNVPGGENTVYRRSRIDPLHPVIEPKHNRESKHEEEPRGREDTEG